MKKKILYMNFIVFSLCFIFSVCQSLKAKEYSDKELLEIGITAIEKRASARGSEEEKAAFRNAFNGLSDAQKIRAISYRVLASDDNPKHYMRASNSAIASYSLGQDRELITDWSELRVMLKETKDPRKFFLIAGLIPWSSDEQKYDFVYELTHMLFADGRVAKNEGEYRLPYADDVSEFAYSAILGKLRSLKADFEPPSKKLRHEEQVVILVKWLRENWPGCENLGDGEPLMADAIRPRKPLTKASVRPEKRLAGEDHSIDPSSSPNKNTLWLATTLGAVLFVALITRILFYGRAQKR